MEKDQVEEYRVRALKIGFGLGPFAYRDRLENAITQQLRFSDFVKRISSQFPELMNQQVTVPTVRHLYDTCLEMRIEKELLAKAIAITGGKNLRSAERWRNMHARLHHIQSAVGNYTYYNKDVEAHLRQQLDGKGPSSTRVSIIKLSHQLAELEQIISWWEELAHQAPWKAFYRGYVWTLNRYLKKRHNLTKELSADVIAAAIRFMRIESAVSQGSIQRSLTREATKPRRFVFQKGVSDSVPW
jgi:hypothetical protein